MIIDYDKGIDVAPEDQVRSLCKNVQLAFDELRIMLQDSAKEYFSSLGINVQELMTSISNLEALTDEIENELEVSQKETQDRFIDLLKSILTEFEIDVTSLDLDSLDFEDKMTAIKTAFIPKLKAVLKDVKDLKENYTALEARVSALEE